MYRLNREMANKCTFFIFAFMFFSACVYGAGEEYNSFGRRDPFVPLVGVPETGLKGGIESILTIEDVELQGIVVDSAGAHNVIINGEVVKKGERRGRLSVESIGENVVVITLDGEKYELKLYKED